MDQITCQVPVGWACTITGTMNGAQQVQVTAIVLGLIALVIVFIAVLVYLDGRGKRR